MLLIGLLALIAFFLSRTLTRRALPFESMLAIGVVGIVCLALFQTGRLS